MWHVDTNAMPGFHDSKTLKRPPSLTNLSTTSYEVGDSDHIEAGVDSLLLHDSSFGQHGVPRSTSGGAPMLDRASYY